MSSPPPPSTGRVAPDGREDALENGAYLVKASGNEVGAPAPPPWMLKEK